MKGCKHSKSKSGRKKWVSRREEKMGRKARGKDWWQAKLENSSKIA